jgi:hypothetical protein
MPGLETRRRPKLSEAEATTMDVFTAFPWRNDNGDERAWAVGLTRWCNRDERDELVLDVVLRKFAASTELTGAMSRVSVVRYRFEPADRGKWGATAAASGRGTVVLSRYLLLLLVN